MSKADGRTIGVFGISGVGKSHLCENFVEKYAGYLHLEASALMKNALGRTGEDLRTADAATIENNQNGLAAAIAQARAARPKDTVLLNAHSVIDNDQGLVSIPESSLSPVGIAAIIFVRADPEIVAMQRLNSERKRPFRSLDQLAFAQQTAQRNCEDYASAWSVSLEIVPANDASAFEDAVLRFSF